MDAAGALKRLPFFGFASVCLAGMLGFEIHNPMGVELGFFYIYIGMCIYFKFLPQVLRD